MNTQQYLSPTCDLPITSVAPTVAAIDLSLVRRKLEKPEAGPPALTPDALDAGILDYRRFLTLHLEHPDAPLVPTRVIDAIWHTHILDTWNYARDCGAVFGHFLHHDPSLGGGGPADIARLQALFTQTAATWEARFGMAYGVSSARCEGHACHVPSGCACRTPGACKSIGGRDA
jgi:hypothetical protein